MASTPKPPKTLSGNLLTMPFMRKAAAAAAASAALPSSPDQPPAKRQKQTGDSPAEFDVNSLADKRAVEAALEKEERIREAAIERAAEQAGDTRWRLSFANQEHNESGSNPKSLRVVHTGYASIDSLVPHISSVGDDSASSPILSGRRSFGKFNRAIERLQNPDAEESSESESEDDIKSEDDASSENEDDDPTGANAMIKAGRLQAAEQVKAERKAKKKAERAESKRLAGVRKKKEVKLNNLFSISGAAPSMTDMSTRTRSRTNESERSRKRKSY